MLISVLIPCRNEEFFIERCIKSVQNFILPEKTNVEIFVIDGMSNDKTRQILEPITKIDTRIKVIDNPRINQAAALNIGIEYSSGDFLLRLDAHASYPKNYLSELYNTYLKVKADCVGGVWITKPGDDSFQAMLVQAITTHPFGVGNASFKIGNSNGYRDTVPYGFFPREIFKKHGGFNELLISGEDYEFNARIRKAGGKIWQNGEVFLEYFNQKTLIRFYRKQFLRDGHYNSYMWYIAPYTFALRHAIPGIFVGGIILGILLSLISLPIFYAFAMCLSLYFLLSFISSIQQALFYKKPIYVLVLPFCFFLFHFSYGLGILSGLFKLFIKKAPVQVK